MTPLFCDWIEIVGIAPFRAVDKIVRAGISVYDVHKKGAACLKLRVKSKETEKIFAIFRGSCYTVTKTGPARLKRALRAVYARAGLAAGAIAFLLLSAASNFFIFRIEVNGSGARYAERAEEILSAEGVRAFALYDGEAAERACEQLAALPGIVFARVRKSGCVVTVTLEESDEIAAPERSSSLVSPRAGIVESLTVLRGTPLVAEGEPVAEGQELVGGFFVTESGEQRETFAIARCSLLCESVFEYRSNEESEAAARRASAAAHLQAGGEIAEEKIGCRAEEGGFVYTVELTVRVLCSVNMG